MLRILLSPPSLFFGSRIKSVRGVRMQLIILSLKGKGGWGGESAYHM